VAKVFSNSLLKSSKRNAEFESDVRRGPFGDGVIRHTNRHNERIAAFGESRGQTDGVKITISLNSVKADELAIKNTDTQRDVGLAE